MEVGSIWIESVNKALELCSKLTFTHTRTCMLTHYAYTEILKICEGKWKWAHIHAYGYGYLGNWLTKHFTMLRCITYSK